MSESKSLYAQTDDAQDEYFLDAPILHTFINEVRRAVAAHTVMDEHGTELVDASAALDTLRPHFEKLMVDQEWLPEEFASPYTKSGMGGAIGSWLLFRSGNRDLSLFSLVVPAGSETPVHDHLAWGFVGLYRGTQEEKVYRREDMGQEHSQDDSHDHHHDAHHHHNEPDQFHDHGHDHSHAHPHTEGEERAVLTVTEVNHLVPGDFYKLLPPYGDIHSVKTTSLEPSISIHLLANDAGCVLRHAYDVERSVAKPFRSGYSNVACEIDEEAKASA